MPILAKSNNEAKTPPGNDPKRFNFLWIMNLSFIKQSHIMKQTQCFNHVLVCILNFPPRIHVQWVTNWLGATLQLQCHHGGYKKRTWWDSRLLLCIMCLQKGNRKITEASYKLLDELVFSGISDKMALPESTCGMCRQKLQSQQKEKTSVIIRVSKECLCQLCYIASSNLGKSFLPESPWSPHGQSTGAVPKGCLRKTSVPSGNVDQRCETCGEPKKTGLHKGACNRMVKYQNLDNTHTPCRKQHIANKYLSEKFKGANKQGDRVTSIPQSCGGWPLWVCSDKNPPRRAKKQ